MRTSQWHSEHCVFRHCDSNILAVSYHISGALQLIKLPCETYCVLSTQRNYYTELFFLTRDTPFWNFGSFLSVSRRMYSNFWLKCHGWRYIASHAILAVFCRFWVSLSRQTPHPSLLLAVYRKPIQIDKHGCRVQNMSLCMNLQSSNTENLSPVWFFSQGRPRVRFPWC